MEVEDLKALYHRLILFKNPAHRLMHLNTLGLFGAMLTTVSFNIDIWENIFSHFALLGYHKTLASCALLNKELATLALRQLYSQQFSPCTSWATPAAREPWETLIFSIPFNIHRPAARPLTSHPYLSYIRRLDTHNLMSVLSLLNWSQLHFFADRLARDNDPGLTKMNHFYLSGADPSDRTLPPPINWRPQNLASRLVEGLVRFSQSQNLRVMLKELTAETWGELVPIVFSCHQLESLTLDFINGLDEGAADAVNERLPKLKNLAFVEASPRHTESMASFLSHLKEGHLHSFKCALERVQSPVFQALAKQTELRELELQFFFQLPVQLHLLTPLTNLMSLTLKHNYNAVSNCLERFQTWADTHLGTIVDWLKACKNLKSLHIFRMPFLIPAVTHALPHLRLDRLHVYGTKDYMDFYRALKTQRLKYLFIGEWPEARLLTHPEEYSLQQELRKERQWNVVEAVCAMRCLRDLRLHTAFALDYQQIQEIALYVPKLKTLSFVRQPGEDAGFTLRMLEEFKHLTSLTVLGLTPFSGRHVLKWIQRTRCNLRPGGFSLNLPSQQRSNWFDGIPLVEYPLRRDPATDSTTMRIKKLLKSFQVWVRGHGGEGETWRGNDYEDAEESVFISIYGEIKGPTAALMAVKGTKLYPPYSGLTADMGFRLA